MISADSPVATCRSATNRMAFAPGSSTPTSAHEASSDLLTRSTRGPRRQAAKTAMSAPASRKRTAAPNNGAIVSPVSSIPR